MSDEVTKCDEKSDEVDAGDVETLEEKINRLENQVSALREISSLRKNLVELREKEMKDLGEKISFFEEAMDTERKLRKDLLLRVEAAECSSEELTEKLRRNSRALSELKSNYEAKVASLSLRLDEAKEEVDRRTDEANATELKNLELNRRVGELNELLDENLELRGKFEQRVNALAHKNKALGGHLTLLNEIIPDEMAHANFVDAEKIKAFRDILRKAEICSEIEEGNGDSRKSSIDLTSLAEKLDDEGTTPDIPGVESCYNNVESLDGSKRVLSVSKTFIKIKDLILEKKGLQKKIDELKGLNFRLKSKMDCQERRLFTVTSELNKTWSLVAKLKLQHDQLHNSEAVLRYELQEKRRLLNKLKSELSQSREMWVKVRAKNHASEIEWEKLRDEFGKRKQQASAESAFSDTSIPKEEEVEEELMSDDAGGDPEEEIREISAMEFQDPLDELNIVNDLVQEISAVTAQVEEAEESQEESTSQATESANTLRANRLRILEEQCRLLYNKLMASTARSVVMTTRLNQLHDHYGPSNPQNSTEPTTSTHFDGEGSSEDAPSVLVIEGSRSNNMEIDEEILEPIALEEIPSILTELEESLSRDSPGPFTEIAIIELDADNSSSGASSSSSPDANELGRLLIQQLPKRLEILKRENVELNGQISEFKAQLVEMEVSMEKKKRDSDALEVQVLEKDEVEIELKEEIKKKEKAIKELNAQIEFSKRFIENLIKEKGRLKEFFKNFSEEKVDLQNARMPKNSSEKCGYCEKKFSLFRRRKTNCKICGYVFCKTCAPHRLNIVEENLMMKLNCPRLCPGCHERRMNISRVIEENL